MSRILIVLDGPSGAGKTDLQTDVKLMRPEIEAIAKVSDRPPAKLAAGRFVADQSYLPRNKFDQRIGEPGFLWYQFAEYRYGFRFDDVALKVHASAALVIVRDHNLIARLKAHGAASGFRVIAFFVNTPKERRQKYLVDQVRRKNEEEGLPPDPSDEQRNEITKRMSRDDLTYPAERQSLSIYDHVLTNEAGYNDLRGEFFSVLDFHLAGRDNSPTRVGEAGSTA